MTFKEALIIARDNEIFRKHFDEVMTAKFHKIPTACMVFAVDGECFYFGFDGVDLSKGKHTEKRSRQLIDRNEALIIR